MSREPGEPLEAAFDGRVVQLFRELARITNDERPVSVVLQRALEAVCEQLDWPLGHLYMVSPEPLHRAISTSLWYVEDPERYANFTLVSDQLEFRPGAGLVGRVMESRRPEWLELQEDPHFRRTEVAARAGLRVGMAVPVLIGAEVVAVLEVFSHRHRGDPAGMAQILADAGTLIGRAVERRWVRAAAGVASGARILMAEVAPERLESEALRESEPHFERLAQCLPLQVWTAAPDGRVDYANNMFIGYFHVPPEQLRAEGLFTLVHPDDRPALREQWDHSLATGDPLDLELRLRDGTGVHRWHLAQARPLRDSAGRIVKWLGTSTDIDALRRAEERREATLAEALARRRRLDHVFAHVPAAICVTLGPQHRVELANPRFEALLGVPLPPGEPLSRGLASRAGAAELLGQLDEVLRTGEAVTLRETHRPPWLRDDSDEEDFVRLSFEPLPHRDPRRSGVLLLAVDVTPEVRARRQAESRLEELARVTAALRRSNRELDQFAYVASHDLKAPLRGIANLSEWLEEDLAGALSPESREHLRLMRSRVERMQSLIDALLAYSRAGRETGSPEEVDVTALLRDVLDLLSPPPALQVELAPMPHLVTDTLPLRQVFHNLLANAVKHAMENPRPAVNVSLLDEGDFVRFRVRDNGPGIAPRYHDRIWGIFVKLERRDVAEGTGIGLALVKKLVESRGGSVGVESQPGEGATFHFSWPKRPHGAPS